MKTYKTSGPFYVEAGRVWRMQVTVTDQDGKESYIKVDAATASGSYAAMAAKMKEMHLG